MPISIDSHELAKAVAIRVVGLGGDRARPLPKMDSKASELAAFVFLRKINKEVTGRYSR